MDSEWAKVDNASEKLNVNGEEPSVKANKTKTSDDFVSESFACTSEFKEDSREEQNNELVDYDFEYSQNYAIRECKGYETTEETSSQYSESDCEEERIRRDCSTTDGMSPFRYYSRIQNSSPIHEKKTFSWNSAVQLSCGPSNGRGVSAIDCQSNGPIDIEELSQTSVDYSRSTSPGSYNFPRFRIIRGDKKDEINEPVNSNVMVPKNTISLGEFLGDRVLHKHD